MKKKIYITHSAHLDLFWMDSIEHCMKDGAVIIDGAVEDLGKNPDKYFVVESVRFLEYYLHQNPEKKSLVQQLINSGQLEVGACYTDRLENHHDGESLVRNVVYGKKMLKKLVDYDSKIATHPDLPGLTEQTPQIYKKAGVKYYLFARGYHDGGRYWWRGLDGSKIMAYNYPIHYTYYDFNKLMKNMDKVFEAISSENVLLSCSAGDLGDYNTFINEKDCRVNLENMIKEYNQNSSDYELVLGNVHDTLVKMGEDNLPTNEGESPCRWGTYGSATNVTLFHQDKVISALLSDAEKLIALCRMNQIDILELKLQHPFGKIVSSHRTRKYFDEIIKPESLDDWIEFAWRLQIITQDHNYGGVEGQTSDFDRTVYKNCAKEIAEKIIGFCVQKIADKADGTDRIVVVNTLNWDRTGEVLIHQPLDKTKCYVAIDKDGNEGKIGSVCGKFYFSPTVTALSYESYKLVEKSTAKEKEMVQGIENQDNLLVMKNEYYTLTIDKTKGGIVSILDGDKELLGKNTFGILRAYEDLSVDVHEELYDKKEIDHTQKACKAIVWGEDELSVWAKLETEICNSKVELLVRLKKGNKEIEFTPVIYWTGMENVQLRLEMNLASDLEELYYGVPYGIQKFGNYIKGAYPANPLDEISDALFEEYREIQGWFSVESQNRGIAVSTNHSSFAFKKKNEIEAMLIRNVKSCGDHDVIISNHGKQEFVFRITPYEGTSILEEESLYKKSWELQHPLYQAVQKSGAEVGLGLKNKLLEVNQEGILSVLSMEGNKATARFFAVSNQKSRLYVTKEERELELKAVDLMGQPVEEDLYLTKGQIKTVEFEV